MNGLISTINVPFHGENLCIVNNDGNPYVPMKPIVEGMGLSWEPQLRKLNQRFSKGMIKMVIPSIGGAQETVCLAMHKLTGWLFSIMPNKVKPEIRDKVIRYQEECDDVLYEYWATGEVKSKRGSTTDDRAPLRNAVDCLMTKKRLSFPKAYGYVHAKYGVNSIDEVPLELLPEAVDYIYSVALEGEYIPKQEALPVHSSDKGNAITCLNGALILMNGMKEYWNDGLKDSLKQLGYQHAGSITEHMIGSIIHISSAINFIEGEGANRLN